ncbi:Mu transposase C-terminal domain-containing protein [Microbacterium sp. K24]|uniref:Mu transposase C-terminal domain-containing protein n=1 Tax=Microbacterium sp. K24 TaxID=2305446 RepID=UPI00109C4036|nr:Mu transposase C-terminal domain-containing protein [Microbacterium sp. K24]
MFLNKQHSGLRSPLFPGRKWTPNQMYAALFDVGPGVQLPFRAEDFFALLPTARRIISDEGIAFQNRRYDSALLADLRNRSLTGAAAGSLQARQFDIHFDPYNTNAVWVQHPETGKWIECWDQAIDDRGAWMAAETEMKMVERFGTGEPNQSPKTAEFLDEIEQRARSDKHARKRHVRDTHANRLDADAPVTEPAPIQLREWADPVDVEGIDWGSSTYDIVTMKEIRS